MAPGKSEKDLKTVLKEALKEKEIKWTERLLRWRYEKEGKQVPEEASLRERAGEVVANAREVVSKRGKRVFEEFRKAIKP
ncbi:hypothetical protein [Desulfatiglans anilini]|uniref:hypothetical protein n=1 Tax=Desulfatiglans anilini TaxID=90728 RepID=UPI00041B43E5|nr:hypothetical protein [Desulfatiglans anilini]